MRNVCLSGSFIETQDTDHTKVSMKIHTREYSRPSSKLKTTTFVNAIIEICCVDNIVKYNS